MQGVIHVAVIVNYPVFEVTGRARPSRHVFYRSLLYALYSTSQLIYPVFDVTGRARPSRHVFYRSILYALCNMLLAYRFGIGSFCG